MCTLASGGLEKHRQLFKHTNRKKSTAKRIKNVVLIARYDRMHKNERENVQTAKNEKFAAVTQEQASVLTLDL